MNWIQLGTSAYLLARVRCEDIQNTTRSTEKIFVRERMWKDTRSDFGRLFIRKHITMSKERDLHLRAIQKIT